MLKKTKYILLGVFLTVLGLWGMAVTIPNSFSSGDVVSAAKMNQNFQALKTSVDALEAKVAALETKVADLEGAQSALPTQQGMPRAYAVVSAAGSLQQQYSLTGGSITATHDATGRYTVDFGDESIIYYDDPVAVTTITSGNFCNADSSGGKLLVKCYDNTGAAADSIFQVVLFNDQNP